MSGAPLLELDVVAEVIEWRGPSPFYFAGILAEHSAAIREAARTASYGWGVVPVTATIGEVTFTTSLFPRDGAYLLPLKDKVRRTVGAVPGERLVVEITITQNQRPSPRA